MKPTYLFYDIETTGLNKAFDQVLQFAAIRTDMNLQELARYNIKVKLNPDCVPSPRALLTHHLTPADVADGMSEYEASLQIHKLLNEPGTISIGYNTLGFDDEFLRFLFYRNLLPPYTHQFSNQCARADLYPITIMYHLFKKDIITWPEINGETKLKLELINHANQLVSGRAHDAMVDVEITLALAKRFFAERVMWDYVLGYFTKQTDQTRVSELPTAFSSPYGKHTEGLMFIGKAGATNYFQTQVLYLGEHDTFKNNTIWLQLDNENLPATTQDNIAENTWAFRKKWGEPGFILPAKERFTTYLSTERRQLAEANKIWLQQHPELLKNIIAYHRAFVFPVIPETDIDARLYNNGFWSAEEMAWCRRFHQASIAEKVLMTENMHHSHLRMPAVRLLGRNYPDALTPAQQQEFADYLRRANSDSATDAIVDFKGERRLTPQSALAEIAVLRQAVNLDQAQLELLDALENYLQQHLRRVD